MNLRDLKLRVRALLTPGRVERELEDELAFHVECETRKLRAEGLPDAEARARALARFGPLPLAADECRDARGTALVDTTIQDLRYAWRGVRRAPLVAVTIVGTVGIGLGLVAAAFTILNMLMFRLDRVPDIDEMVALERPPSAVGESAPFRRADMDAIRNDTNIFSGVYAEVTGIDVRVDGRSLLSTLTTGDFFQVVGVRAVMGRTLTPDDDRPGAGRAVIVLSDRGWDRMFGRARDVIGRTVVVNTVPFEVVGVMPPGFRGLAVTPPDYWAPLAMLGAIQPSQRGREADAGVRIAGRLKRGMSRETALAGLSVWAGAQASGVRSARDAAGIALIPWRGTVQQPLEAMLITGPLFFAFGLVLVIGCANVANLLLARSVARQRELGIRLSLGAARGRIIRQLLTESLLLAVFAALAGFAISRVALHVIVNAVTASWPPEIGNIQLLVPDADWRVLLFLLTGAGASTLFFGLVPALQATRLEPIRTMREEVARDVRPGRARGFLIGLQVGASALLLICAAIFLRSAFAAATEDTGMRVSDTVAIAVRSETSRAAIVQAVKGDPSIATVAAAWPFIDDAPRTALAETGNAKGTVTYRFVSSEYFGVLDIPIARGRTFAQDERTADASVAIVSETTARALWPDADAVGQTIRLDADPGATAPQAKDPPIQPRTFTVVGVVRDVAGFRMIPFTKAVVYLPATVSMPTTALVVRVHGDPDVARESLLRRLNAIDPDMAGVVALVWVTRMETYLLQVGFWLTVSLGVLALALTLSGLFSVLSYLVEQRTREIGVRMALGATARHVTQMVLAQSIRPVGAGLLAGSGLAAALSALLLATPAAGAIAQMVRVLDPVAYGGSLLVIMLACLAAASIPAARAARLDPVRTLRQE